MSASHSDKTPSLSANASSSFDLQAARVYAGGSDEMLLRMVQLFLEECPRQMDPLRLAWEQRDGATMARAAHLLKGSLLIFAAEPATTLAQQLEQLAREQRLDSLAAEIWQQLQQEVEQLLSALQQWQAEQRQTPDTSTTDPSTPPGS